MQLICCYTDNLWTAASLAVYACSPDRSLHYWDTYLRPVVGSLQLVRHQCSRRCCCPQPQPAVVPHPQQSLAESPATATVSMPQQASLSGRSLGKWVQKPAAYVLTYVLTLVAVYACLSRQLRCMYDAFSQNQCHQDCE